MKELMHAALLLGSYNLKQRNMHCTMKVNESRTCPLGMYEWVAGRCLNTTTALAKQHSQVVFIDPPVSPPEYPIEEWVDGCTDDSEANGPKQCFSIAVWIICVGNICIKY